MKEIDDIVRLYEGIDKQSRYYMLEMTRDDYRIWIFYIREDSDPVTITDDKIVVPPGSIDMYIKTAFDKAWERRDHYYSEGMEFNPLHYNIEEIKKEDIAYITKNNISSVKEYRIYKSILSIKNPNSTMMDVLCAFGDL